MLINGQWVEKWQPVQASDDEGRFIRQASDFRQRGGQRGRFRRRTRALRALRWAGVSFLTPFEYEHRVRRGYPGVGGVVHTPIWGPSGASVEACAGMNAR